MAARGQKKGGGSRKIDRHKRNGQNGAYKAEGRHEKSHRRRIERHVARHGADPVAAAAYERYGGIPSKLKALAAERTKIDPFIAGIAQRIGAALGATVAQAAE